MTGLTAILPELGPVGKMLELLSPLSFGVLFLLLLFSVASWAIVISKWFSFRRQDQQNRQFSLLYAKTDDVDILRTAARGMSHSTVAGLFLRGMDGVEYRMPAAAVQSFEYQTTEERMATREDLNRFMGVAIQEESARLESLLPVLATIGSISPFVGLFGTVLGIINAFAAIGEQATANIRTVAPGMAEALIATAAGLFAAIPAVIFYNYCLTRIRREIQTMESFSADFLMTVAGRVFRADVKASV